MQKLVFKQGKVFHFKYWYAGYNLHTSRVVFEITPTDNEYPYRVTIDGNYHGDFTALKTARDYCNKYLTETWIPYVKSKGIS